MPMETVLLVEDETNDVLLFQRAWKKAGLPGTVQVVGDGEAATHYLAGTGPYGQRERYPLPHMVLLDLKLPRRSGLDVLSWVKGEPYLRRLPVIVLTSSREAPDLSRAYDLGANSYLLKPVKFEALLALVQTVGLYWGRLNEAPEVTRAS